MTYKSEHVVKSVQETLDLSKKIANEVLKDSSRSSKIVFLNGELGAGKTTFTKGFLQGLGYEELVKSPTFNIIDTYKLEGITVYHFDLYRIESVKELKDIGISEYLEEPNAICIFEWPEKLGTLINNYSFMIDIQYSFIEDNPNLRKICIQKYE
tara:strand:- start:41516 stop:41977 length:462 start_codon:yes stop_codon:yes gene_type:complete